MIKKLAFIGIVIVLLIYMLQPLVSTFAGTHSIEKQKNSTDYGMITFCAKCHEEEVYLNNLSVHKITGCVCHGYAPNLTQAYNVNAAHNLTKDIYCTNCHTNYDNNGNQQIYPGTTTGNQSGHYIMKNSTILYDHAQKLFPGN
ncbi:MAG TPA: cytochrome c3 family protein [Candidatus Limnocylindrales bacterium]|nr:cytochrome c3 family protein [Candidatus Limnocylindrales bacterium]